MVTFDLDDARFTLRAAAVCLHQGYVLLHRAEHDDFWAMPGGRVEVMEPAAETLRREMLEEIGVEVQVGGLLWLVENYFEHGGRRHHELGLYFRIELPEDSAQLDKHLPFVGLEEGLKLYFEWFAVEELENVRLFPSFLRTALARPPAHPVHVVHHDEDEPPAAATT